MPYTYRRPSFYETVRSLGLLGNIEHIIHAGDARCYSGNDQPVYDLSGKASHFVLGLNNTVEATFDPVFAGNAGRRSVEEYFRGTNFTFAISRPSLGFGDSLHHDGAIFTVAMWRRESQIDLVNGTGLWQTWDTTVPANTDGIGFGIFKTGLGHNGTFGMQCIKPGPTAVANIFTDIAAVAGSPVFYAMSFNEVTGNWIGQVNGTQATGNVTYSAPTAGAANSGLIKLRNSGDPTGGYSGDTFADAAWSRDLSAVELMKLFNATRQGFGV